MVDGDGETVTVGVISVGAVTVNVTGGLEIVPMVAVICVEPAARPVATPLPMPIVATEGLEELQVTEVVMFCVLALL
jgi:hypothetical protein